MSTTASLRKLGPLVLGVAVLLPVGQANAHVRLITPNGGEELEVGSTFEIRWTIVIQHNQLNWDLWYSTNSNAGPWTTVAMDLPPGPFGVGTEHTYDWTVPDDVDETVWVRVRMDNAGQDYEDVNDQPFAIVAGCPADIDDSGAVDFDDLLLILSEWGPYKDCPPFIPADIDEDCDVDFDDLLRVLAAWGPCE